MLKRIFKDSGEELSQWSRFLIFQFKLWRHCARLLKHNRSGQQAAALSYHTLFGIVPLAIVMLMVFQAFPTYRDVGDNVKLFIYKQMNLDKIEYPGDSENGQSSVELTDKIDDITASFVANLNTKAITGFSVIIVAWAAIGLLTTIERAFNGIWHAPKGRNFVSRIVNYWALLTLGPLLMGLGFYLSTNYLITGGIQSQILACIRPMFPYLISVVALFFLYFVLPNTKVNAKAAIWGAAVAALLWTGAKYLFSIYVTKFIPNQAIYGVMGIIPLGVLWIYITWLVVLFGLQLTFATQHLKTLDAAELASMNKEDELFLLNDMAAIKILAYILDAFEKKQAPVSADLICNKLDLPGDFGQKILNYLVRSGLLLRTVEPESGFVPATDGNNITLAEISEVIAKISFTPTSGDSSKELTDIFDAHQKILAQYTLKQILPKDTPKSQNNN